MKNQFKIWVYDSEIQKSILGLNIVMLAWSDGKTTILIAIKVYQKENGKTKIDLAIELLKYAKSLKIQTDYITFDSWYSAEKLLRAVRKMKTHFITRIKKNRKINGVQTKKLYRNPYWIIQGKISD